MAYIHKILILFILSVFIIGVYSDSNVNEEEEFTEDIDFTNEDEEPD